MRLIKSQSKLQREFLKSWQNEVHLEDQKQTGAILN